MTVPHGLGEDQGTTDPAPSRRRDLRLVVTGVLLALGIWFAVGNTQEVKIRFWVVSTRTPVVSALVIAAVFGVAIGLLIGRRFRRPSS